MEYDLKADNPVTNEGSKEATGKTLDQWFDHLDKWDGLKKGRRAVNNHLAEEKIDPWWCTTISVEYEKHHDVRKKDGAFEGYFVCSTKTISAPVSDVFDSWSRNDSLTKWFGKSPKAEVKDGGTYQTGDGEKGSFTRVRSNKDIRMTLENKAFTAPILVDVQFQDKGKGKTGLLVNLSRIQTREEADGVRVAWAAALDRLKAFCEK